MIISWLATKEVFQALPQTNAEYDALEHTGWTRTRDRRWITTNLSLVEPWQHRMGPLAIAEYQARIQRHVVEIEASKLGEAEFMIDSPPGKVPRPFQLAGVAYAIRRRHTLIADEPGLGKTIEAVLFANHDPFIRRVLVICPATLRINWKKEWQAWGTTQIYPLVVRDIFPKMASDRALIISYEGASKWRDRLLALPFDLMILDEAHYLKSTSAKRTRVILGAAGRGARKNEPGFKADRILMLTGTPIINKPEELWPLIRRLDVKREFGTKSDFISYYCQCREEQKPARLAQLHQRLRAAFMVRRLKSEVLTELPPKSRQLVFLDIPGVKEILAAEEETLRKARMTIDRLTKRIVEEGRSGDAVRAMNEGLQLSMVEIARARHQTALRKAPFVASHVAELLSEHGKLLVFAHHHDVTDTIFGLLRQFGPVIYDGRTSHTERDQIIARFMTDPACRVFIGGIRAAGLGLTLTAASVAVFAELDWTPAGMSQAEDRIHRIGQRDSVLVQHLLIDHSIDAKMAQILLRKQAIIDMAMDGAMPPEMSKPILRDLLKEEA